MHTSGRQGSNVVPVLLRLTQRVLTETYTDEATPVLMKDLP